MKIKLSYRLFRYRFAVNLISDNLPNYSQSQGKSRSCTRSTLWNIETLMNFLRKKLPNLSTVKIRLEDLICKGFESQLDKLEIVSKFCETITDVEIDLWYTNIDYLQRIGELFGKSATNLECILTDCFVVRHQDLKLMVVSTLTKFTKLNSLNLALDGQVNKGKHKLVCLQDSICGCGFDADIARSLPNLKSFTYRESDFATSKADLINNWITCTNYFTKLEKLCFEMSFDPNEMFNSQFLASIGSLQQLKSLKGELIGSLPDCFNASIMQITEGCQHLETLDLSFNNAIAPNIDFIQGMIVSFETLKSLTNLYLFIRASIKISTQNQAASTIDISSLEDNSHLRKVDLNFYLRNCYKFAPIFTGLRDGLRNVKSLTLSCRNTDLSELCGLPNLVSLNLTRAGVSRTVAVTDFFDDGIDLVFKSCAKLAYFTYTPAPPIKSDDWVAFVKRLVNVALQERNRRRLQFCCRADCDYFKPKPLTFELPRNLCVIYEELAHL